jgi:Transposase IS116/IS110/IS902 family
MRSGRVSLEREIIAWHRSSELSRKLEKISGIGPLAASALAASIVDAHSFDNGRQVSAWLGLVPRQSSSDAAGTLPLRPFVRQPSPQTIRLDAPPPDAESGGVAVDTKL